MEDNCDERLNSVLKNNDSDSKVPYDPGVKMESSEKEESDGIPSAVFKKPTPLLIGPQRGKNQKNLNRPKSLRPIKELSLQKDEPISNPDNSDSVVDQNNISQSKNTVKNDELATVINKTSSDAVKLPLPYKEPEWGGCPELDYKLEELKSGTIVKTINLTNGSFFVFGRLEHCDIPMLHPTVSRYHAVLQYRADGDEQNECGFYIYDLGSSLGTFLNKQKLKPKTFVRVKVGHVLKLACSTRIFVLQGPADDEEPESELSVTELRQQQKERLAALQAEQERREAEEAERIKREEERGIDWGMGEDADEETDLTENPYATTQNEELYLDDPKKTLRGWFEREGEELVYDVEEKGFGHFICRIELPVDNGAGDNMVAEASVKGKKKEAVVQAALEACRMLDRQGLLRQSAQESKKKAAKDWEAVDFYDSDEDNFLDRTGQIEKKRKQRMAQSGKLEKEVETYDSLVEKYSTLLKELEHNENNLNKMLSLATQVNREKDDEDELDAYMNTLKQVPADKIEIRKMKNEVARLRAEEEKLRKLVNIARPTELPKLEPPKKNTLDKKAELPHGMVGKKFTKKRESKGKMLPLQTTQQQGISDIHAEEEEEDEEEEEKEKVLIEEKMESGENSSKSEAPKKKRNRPDTRIRHGKRQAVPMQVDEEDYNNLAWTPPVGQTGDGRTRLNDKLGY